MKPVYLYIILLVLTVGSCNSPRIEGQEKINLILSTNGGNTETHLEILKNRLLNYGYRNDQFKLIENQSNIQVSISNVEDIEEIKFLILSKGNVSFNVIDNPYDVKQELEKSYSLIQDSSNFIPLLTSSNELFETTFDTTKSLKTQVFEKLQFEAIGNEQILKCFTEDTPIFNHIIKFSNFKDHPNRVLWAPSSFTFSSNETELIVLNKDQFNLNKYLDNVSWSYEGDGIKSLIFELNPVGTKILKRFTEKRIHQRLPFMIDHTMIAVPILTAPLSEGKIQFSGPEDKIKNLVISSILKAGVYPSHLSIIGEGEIK